MLFKGLYLELNGFGLLIVLRVTIGLKDENDFLIKNIQGSKILCNDLNGKEKNTLI